MRGDEFVKKSFVQALLDYQDIRIRAQTVAQVFELGFAANLAAREHPHPVRHPPEEYFVRKRLLDLFVNEPRHWPSAVTRIETVFRQPFAGILGQFYQDTLLRELSVELADKFVDDQLDDVHIERLERHPR